MRPMKFKQLAVDLLDSAAVHPDTVMQQKVDGIRAMLKVTSAGGKLNVRVVGGGGKGLKSTTAAPTAERLMMWASATFTTTTAYELFIDGEVIGDEWWAFDLVRSPKTNEFTPLWRRLRMLEAMLPKLSPPTMVKLLPTAWTIEEKKALIAKVRLSGGEGVMVKQRASMYHWDERVKHSLKVKFTHTVDCVVLARNVGGPDKQNAVLGVMDGCETVEIGNCSMIGKPDAQVGEVVEVRYLYAGAGGKLVQPTLLRIRRDKHRADCGPDQLSFVNKEVLSW